MRYSNSRRSSSSSLSPLLEAALAVGGAALVGYFAGRTVLRQRRKIDLTNKVAVVTGGSTGIGYMIATELVARGARVAICGRREQELRRAQEKLQEQGGSVFAS